MRLAVPIALIDFIAISAPRLAVILRRAPFAPPRLNRYTLRKVTKLSR
jgi:hypothetical protein